MNEPITTEVKNESGASLAPARGSASGMDLQNEIRKLRAALRAVELNIVTNPTPAQLDKQLAIIAEALE